MPTTPIATSPAARESSRMPHEESAMRGAAYVARGLAWQKKGDDDRALADFNGAISVNPKDALAYNNRGMLWRERGESDRAIADFTAAIAIDPLPRSDEAIQPARQRRSSPSTT